MVFQKAIDKALPAPEVHGRVANLIDCISHSVFMYTSRGLFECDKLIFSSQMAFQVKSLRTLANTEFSKHFSLVDFSLYLLNLLKEDYLCDLKHFSI